MAFHLYRKYILIIIMMFMMAGAWQVTKIMGKVIDNSTQELCGSICKLISRAPPLVLLLILMVSFQ
ncbi:MAG: hypothetical protein R2759_17175 [Bacteroidales bacterium]